MESYAFDHYAEALFAAAMRAIEEVRDDLSDIPMVSRLHFQAMTDAELPVLHLSMTVDDDDLDDLELDVEYEGALPDTIDESDPLIAEIRGLTNLDEEESEEAVGWGDVDTFPHCLYIAEILRTGEQVVEELLKEGWEADENLVISYGGADDVWEDAERFEVAVRETLLYFDDEQREELSPMLYTSPEKQQWFEALEPPED